MRLLRTYSAVVLLANQSMLALADSRWGFSDATLTVQGKGSGVGSGSKEKLSDSKALSSPVQLGTADSLKIILTIQEGKRASRPHQAFLLVEDAATGLETSFPFAVKDNGKAKLEITHKDIPAQLISSSTTLAASLIFASFGSSKPYHSPAFALNIALDPSAPRAVPESPLRYGKLPAIHHIFKTDPRSPPKFITIVFTAAVLAAVPTLAGLWLSLGANANHVSKALGGAPVAHILFFGSIFAMEGIFFMYYSSWNLFQTLPAAAVVGTVTFLSGSRALTEVQERRLAGLR
ncbi:hypothetical protein MMC09_007041 [Bachmanniomyces sp. S44760]|nr:hypothetical protein [Bachmanniomyces sp. S44760]